VLFDARVLGVLDESDVRIRCRLRRQRDRRQNRGERWSSCRAQRGRWYRAGRGGAKLLPRAFVAVEEEDPIAANAAAEAAAELLHVEGWLLGTVEKVPRIEAVVAEERVAGSVKGVRARLGDGADDGAGGAAVLGRVIGRQDAHFLDTLDT